MASEVSKQVESLLDDHYTDVVSREVFEGRPAEAPSTKEEITEIPDGGATFIKERGPHGANLIHFDIGGQLVETQDEWVRATYDHLEMIAKQLEEDPTKQELITLGKDASAVEVPKWIYEQLMQEREESQADPKYYFASDKELYKRWIEGNAEPLFSKTIYEKVMGRDNLERRLQLARVAKLYREAAEGFRIFEKRGRIPTYNQGNYGF